MSYNIFGKMAIGFLVYVSQVTVYPASFASIDSAYQLSRQYFVKRDFSAAHEVLKRSMGETDDFANVVSETERKKFLPILNDYAFYIYKDFESQSKFWCEDPAEIMVRAFLIFRSQTLDKAEAVLKYVVSQDSTREVALLNLADIYLNLDDPEKAEDYYSRYITQMSREGKTAKIVARARNPSLRRRAFDCR